MASVPYEFECDEQAGFLADPNEHKCIGYVTSFGGLSKDLTVSLSFFQGFTPTYTGIPSKASSTKVVGVIDKFSWAGGVGSPIQIDFYVSQQNATQIKTAQQSSLTTKVSSLGWWIVDYDQESRQWYEASYPMSAATINGLIQAKSMLNVDLTPVPAKDGIVVNVCRITLSVAPGGNTSYALRFANSPTKPVVKSWGLVVGTLASAAI